MSNCSCPRETEDEPTQNFWQNLAAKYEQRVQNLRNERHAIRQRLELLQLQMPIYLCYNLKRFPRSADQCIEQFMQMYIGKSEATDVPSKCMCNPCPLKVPANFPKNLYSYTYPQKLSRIGTSKPTKRTNISEHTLKENLICDCQYCVKMVTKRLQKEKEMETAGATYSRFSEKLTAEKDTGGSNDNPVDMSKDDTICECNECAEEVIRRIASPEVEFEPLRCGCGQSKRQRQERGKRKITKTNVIIPKNRNACGKTNNNKGKCTCVLNMPKMFKDAAICDCSVCAEEVIKRIASPDTAFEPLSCGCDGSQSRSAEVDIPICQCDSCKLEFAKRSGQKDDSGQKQPKTECPCSKNAQPSGDLICDCDICAEKLAGRDNVDCECVVGDDTVLPICDCSECKKDTAPHKVEFDENTCICNCDICLELRKTAKEEAEKIKYNAMETTIKCICNCDICNGESNKEQEKPKVPCDGRSPEGRKAPEQVSSEECLCEEEEIKSSSETSCTCAEEESGETESVESCTCSGAVSVEIESVESCTCSGAISVEIQSEQDCKCTGKVSVGTSCICTETISVETSCTCAGEISPGTVTPVPPESCTCSEESHSAQEMEASSVTESCLCPSQSFSSEHIVSDKSTTPSRVSSCTCSAESTREIIPSVKSCVCSTEAEFPDQTSIEQTDSCTCSISSGKLTQESTSIGESDSKGNSEDSCICPDKEMVPVEDPTSRSQSESSESVSLESMPEQRDSNYTCFEEVYDVIEESDSSCSCSEVYDVIEQSDTSCECSEDTFVLRGHSSIMMYFTRSLNDLRCETDQRRMRICTCAVPLRNCFCLVKQVTSDDRKSGQQESKISLGLDAANMLSKPAAPFKTSTSKVVDRRHSEPSNSCEYRKEYALMMGEAGKLTQLQAFQVEESYKLIDDFAKRNHLVETFASLHHCSLEEDALSDISDYKDCASDIIESKDLSVSEVYIAKRIGCENPERAASEVETSMVATTKQWILEMAAPPTRYDAKPIRLTEHVYRRTLSEEWIKETKSVCSCMVDLETYDSDEPPPDCATEEERCCCVRMKTDNFTKLFVEKYITTADEVEQVKDNLIHE